MDAHLANIVQGRRLEQQLNVVAAQGRGKARVLAQRHGQALDIALGAQNMVAGFVVACFCHGCQGQHGDILNSRDLTRAPADLGGQVVVFVAHEVSRGFEAEVCAHPGQHNGRADWLGDVVSCAELQAQYLIGYIAFGGHEDHRNIPASGRSLDAPQHLVAVQAGHHDVQQNQIWQDLAGQQCECALAAIGHLQPVVGAQQLGHQEQVLWGVVHHHHGGGMGAVAHSWLILVGWSVGCLLACW